MLNDNEYPHEFSEIWHAVKARGLRPEQFGELGLASFALPGLKGQIKTATQDFFVEEIPAYQPSGSGDHLFLWLEKTGLSADELRQHILKALQLSPVEVGMAGQKDKHAVTRQFVSVPKSAEALLPNLASADVKILSVTAHPHKLRIGHLTGNHFKIRIRLEGSLSSEAALAKSEQIAQRLQTVGVPNFFGRQRFGSKGDTAQIGFRLLKGDKAGLNRRWHQKGNRLLALSAAQASLFNYYLLKRLTDWGVAKIVAGDVMRKSEGSGVFRVADVAEESRRCQLREVVSTGPMFGKKMFLPEGESLALEAAVLSEYGLKNEMTDYVGKGLSGARRPNFVFIDKIVVTREPDAILLAFDLPSGSYATVVLAEFLKPILGD